MQKQFQKIKQRQDQIFEDRKGEKSFVQKELKKVQSSYLRHGLVRHFDNLHKIN